MRLLTPHIPYDAAETVQSYAARLSLFHTGRGPSRLLEACGVRPARFAAGHHDEVAKFAGAVGEEIDDLQAGTIHTLSRYSSFRRDFSRTVLSIHVRQFCPHCLRDEGPPAEWRHRIIWCSLLVPVCLRHRAALVEVTPGDAADIRNAVACAGGLDVAEASTSYAKGARHLAFLHERLSFLHRPGWLAGHSSKQVLNALEMLGMVLEHGQGVRPGRLSRQERSSTLETGFRIYEEGADAVYGALGDIRRGASATAVHAGPLAMYGALYDWLDRRSQLIAPGPVRDILREHILNHDAYAPSDRLLGEPVARRRLHSVISLAMTLKINRRRMSRLLQKLGLCPRALRTVKADALYFPLRKWNSLSRITRPRSCLPRCRNTLEARRARRWPCIGPWFCHLSSQPTRRVPYAGSFLHVALWMICSQGSGSSHPSMRRSMKRFYPSERRANVTAAEPRI
jgi:hypothetical protein